MKKYFWITAFFLALAMVFTACPGGGDDEVIINPGDIEFWLAANDSGVKLGDGTVKTLVGQAEDNYVHIFFTPPGNNFDKIKINFTYGESGIGFNMSWQCVYDANGTWGQSGDDYIDWLEHGPIEIDPSVMFKSGWGTIANGAKALDKKTMKGICLRVSIPEDNPNATFTLTSVEFL
jgi:phosphoribulokinase